MRPPPYHAKTLRKTSNAEPQKPLYTTGAPSSMWGQPSARAKRDTQNRPAQRSWRPEMHCTLNRALRMTPISSALSLHAISHQTLTLNSFPGDEIAVILARHVWRWASRPLPGLAAQQKHGCQSYQVST